MMDRYSMSLKCEIFVKDVVRDIKYRERKKKNRKQNNKTTKKTKQQNNETINHSIVESVVAFDSPEIFLSLFLFFSSFFFFLKISSQLHDVCCGSEKVCLRLRPGRHRAALHEESHRRQRARVLALSFFVDKHCEDETARPSRSIDRRELIRFSLASRAGRRRLSQIHRRFDRPTRRRTRHEAGRVSSDAPSAPTLSSAVARAKTPTNKTLFSNKFLAIFLARIREMRCCIWDTTTVSSFAGRCFRSLAHNCSVVDAAGTVTLRTPNLTTAAATLFIGPGPVQSLAVDSSGK